MSIQSILSLRARVRSGVRQLFDRLGFLEVDTPTLSPEVLPEAHIEPIAVFLDGQSRPPHYLQASPEALMKRLLAGGAGPIYHLAQAFRAGEHSSTHDSEFTLLEWYAPKTTLSDASRVLEQLCQEVLGTGGIQRLTCSQVFLKYAGVDPQTASLRDLERAGQQAGLQLPEGHAELPAEVAWDFWFEILLAEVVTPKLGRGQPTMLEAWPVSQAAFAKLDRASPQAALRFELFVEGVELANGWEEETSRSVLRARIDAANRTRVANGRKSLPLPTQLLAAHRSDGPDSATSSGTKSLCMPEGVGAALGFDRLVMLAAGADSIAAVRCFKSSHA